MGLLKTATHAAVAGWAISKGAQHAAPTPQMNVPCYCIQDGRLYAHHFQGAPAIVGFDLPASREWDATYRWEAAKAGFVVRETLGTPGARGWTRYIFEANPAAASNLLNGKPNTAFQAVKRTILGN